MDWPLVISHNRDALLRVLASLFAMTGAASMLPRPVYWAVLGVLRPAEAAARRLIAIAAHGLALKPRPLRVPQFSSHGAPTARIPAFRLTDSLKRTAPWAPRRGPAPRISVPGFFEPAFAARLSKVETLSATGILRRLHALKAALDRLPEQALRLARWQARRARPSAKPMRLTQLRPGFPPGWRRRPVREIDAILRECHMLALDRRNAPDSG